MTKTEPQSDLQWIKDQLPLLDGFERVFELLLQRLAALETRVDILEKKRR